MESFCSCCFRIVLYASICTIIQLLPTHPNLLLGTCAHGVCSHPPAPNYVTLCDDSQVDSSVDRCIDGICVGRFLCANRTCQAASQCHEIGTCNVATGVCSNPVRTGFACNDGNSSTVNDRCTSIGECRGTPNIRFCRNLPIG